MPVDQSQNIEQLQTQLAMLKQQISAMQMKLNTALQPTSLISPAQLPAGPGTGLNADKVDGINASRQPQPNVLVPLDSTGKFPASTIPIAPITYPITVPQGGTDQTSFTATLPNTISIPYLVTGGLQFADDLTLINMDSVLGTLGIGQANPSGTQGQGLVVKARRTGTDYTCIDMFGTNGAVGVAFVGESDGFHLYTGNPGSQHDRFFISSSNGSGFFPGFLGVGGNGPTNQLMVGALSDTSNVNVRINGLTTTGTNTGTLSNCPHSGNPDFYLEVNVNGTTYCIPCFELS